MRVLLFFRNLSIAILIWMMIFFLHGFFGELYKIFKEEYKDWKNKRRILHRTDKLVKKICLNGKEKGRGSIRITVKRNKNK